MERTLENKNRTISLAKGIAIFLVVYGHVIQRHMVAAGEDFFRNPVFQIIYTFHMPLFVFLSGYLLASSLKRRSVGEVIQSRVARLLIPYVTWGFLGVITTLFLMSAMHEVIQVQGVFAIITDQMILNPAVWFLWTLFVIAGLALCASVFAKQFGPMAHVLFGGVIVFFPYNQHFGLYYIQWFYVFFIIGFAVYDWKQWVNPKHLKFIFILSGMVFIALQSFWNTLDFIYVHKMIMTNWGDAFRLCYRYLMGFLGIVVVLGVSSQLSRVNVFSWVEKIGLYSLDIYLIQRYLVEGLYGQVIVKYPIEFNHEGIWFLSIFAPLIAFIFSMACIIVSIIFLRRFDILSRLFLGRGK